MTHKHTVTMRTQQHTHTHTHTHTSFQGHQESHKLRKLHNYNTRDGLFPFHVLIIRNDNTHYNFVFRPKDLYLLPSSVQAD